MSRPHPRDAAWYQPPPASELPRLLKGQGPVPKQKGQRRVLGELSSNQAQPLQAAQEKKSNKIHPNAENVPPPQNRANVREITLSTSSAASLPWIKPSTSSSNLPFKIHVDNQSAAAAASYEAEDVSADMAVENRLMAGSSKNADFWADKIASLPQIPTLAQIERGGGQRAFVRPFSVDGIPMEVGGPEASPMTMDESMSAATSPLEESSAAKRFRSSSMGPKDESVLEEAAEACVEPDSQLSDYEDSLEYCPEIIRHLCDTETKHMPKHNYMEKQPDITFAMRQILVDWLVEVSEEYKLHQETLYLTVNFIDRFLSFMSVQRPKLQLVGTACMFIAAKYEEIYPPDVGEFVYITDDTYSKKQVLRMEHLVLKVLGFELSIPTPLYFVNVFAKVSGCSKEESCLAQYLSELTLMDGMFLQYRPSEIGASAVAIARHTCGQSVNAWPAVLESLTEYNTATLKGCVGKLQELFTKASTLPQQAIREKYSTEKYCFVGRKEPVV